MAISGRFQVGQCSALSCWWLCREPGCWRRAEPCPLGSVHWAPAPVFRGYLILPDAKAAR